MVKYDQEADQVWFTIPLSGIHELNDYQNGILAILKKVEIEEFEKAFGEDLKRYHGFLQHMLADEGFFAHNEKLLLEPPPTVRLPPKVELAISLIKAELKNLKFINDMLKQGIDASASLWDFGELILGLAGFDNDISDELNEWYFTRQTQLVKDIEAGDDEDFSHAAFDFYIDLMVKRQELDPYQD